MSVTITFQKKHFLMLGLIIAIPFLILAISTIMATVPSGQYHPISELWVDANIDMQGNNITNTGDLDVAGNVRISGDLEVTGTYTSIELSCINQDDGSGVCDDGELYCADSSGTCPIDYTLISCMPRAGCAGGQILAVHSVYEFNDQCWVGYNSISGGTDGCG
ncbi:hypothetical protein GQ473_06670, partial [archaeon]|nr:hypothetical protein [archaeon]